MAKSDLNIYFLKDKQGNIFETNDEKKAIKYAKSNGTKYPYLFFARGFGFQDRKFSDYEMDLCIEYYGSNDDNYEFY
jgi:hypothetical protein